MAPTRLCLLVLSLPLASLHAGVLQGVALENQTSRPLARARLAIARLEGNRLVRIAETLSARSGQFAFPKLPEGHFVLTAIRPGFAETRSEPILIPHDASQFVEMRLKRLGAITGRTLDENHVGLPGIPVVAYTAAPPSQIAATATSDDRGVFRLTGLRAGSYYVRTDGARLEDTLQVLPTYFPFASTLLREARAVEVALDADTTDLDIQPVPGRTASLTVSVQECMGVAEITLASDTGRRTATATCGVSPAVFSALAPGEYEILAEGASGRQPVAAFLPLYLDKDREYNLALRGTPEVFPQFTGAAGLLPRDIAIVVRRRDLAGPGPERTLTAERLALPPGYWQLAVRPPASHYPLAVKPDSGGPRGINREPSPDWFEFFLNFSTPIAISLSSSPAQLSGRVQLAGKPAIAAPVYLLPTAQPTRRRMNGLRIAHAAVDGSYRFDGLAPGEYRVLASFKPIDAVDETLASQQARAVTVEDGRPATLDLLIER